MMVANKRRPMMDLRTLRIKAEKSKPNPLAMFPAEVDWLQESDSKILCRGNMSGGENVSGNYVQGVMSYTREELPFSSSLTGLMRI